MAAWKILHERILVDTALQRHGETLCSRCSFCNIAAKSLSHLFMGCPFVNGIWQWLFCIFKIPRQHNVSLPLLFSTAFIAHLPMALKILWRMAACNLLWCTWMERNKIRFDGSSFCPLRFKQFFFLSFKDSASTYFSPSSTSQTADSVFFLLGLSPLCASAHKFIPVVWKPPPIGWIKVNTDGSFNNNSRTGFGGVYRDHEGIFLGGFSSKVVVPSAIDAEILAVLEALQVAWVRRWTHIWLETDSALMILYFKSPHLVPWRLSTQWKNCLYLSGLMTFRISHIFREGNSVADGLAKYGADNEGSVWWRTVPRFLISTYGYDLCSGPNFRRASISP